MANDVPVSIYAGFILLGLVIITAMLVAYGLDLGSGYNDCALAWKRSTDSQEGTEWAEADVGEPIGVTEDWSGRGCARRLNAAAY